MNAMSWRKSSGPWLACSRALFATSAYFKRFVGWSEEESRALLAYLQGLAQHLQYHCRVKWRKDTLLVWDNRFTLHRGIHDFKYERRHLIRTTVVGERPLGTGHVAGS